MKETFYKDVGQVNWTISEKYCQNSIQVDPVDNKERVREQDVKQINDNEGSPLNH